MNKMNKIGIICKTGVTKPIEILKELLPWLRKKGCETFIDIETASILNMEGFPRSKIPSLSEVIIVLGGDGTMLSTCRLVADKGIPVLGINIGGLGFITEVQIDKLYETLDRVLSDECPIEERIMLAAKVRRLGEIIAEYIVLNEVVVNKAALARIIDLETYVNQNYVTTFKADGLIISTPTGSTAYSLSAGGPILYPTLDNIIITPICPHTLTNRSMVIPGDSIVKIILSSPTERIYLTMDGQVGFSVMQNDIIEVAKAPFKTRLLIPCDRDYFQILRTKLRWGER